MTTQTPTETRELVREHYGQVAKTDGACGCGPGCCGGGATASTDLGYDAAELAELPKGAVARLPEAYRHAITLVELQGVSQAEAAAMEGISLSGMKSRVQRGRRMLREMFEECCSLKIDARGHVMEADRRDAATCGPSCAEPCG